MPEIEQSMIFLWHVDITTMLCFDAGHQELLEDLQVESVLMLIVIKEIVLVDRVENYAHWWHPEKLNDF